MSNEAWGPLAALIGEWEGEGGLDRAYAHAKGKVLDTPYLEKVSMKPFGPVGNGAQELYGLDYKTAMWRDSEDNPFHTEVGYWLWDAKGGQVMRCFVVPRGITVMAGGAATATSNSFSLAASLGAPIYGISENLYLAQRASTKHYEVKITANRDGTWSYDEVTVLQMKEFDEPFLHTDRNTLRRAG